MIIEPFVLSVVEAWTAQRDSPFDRLRANGTIPIFGVGCRSVQVAMDMW
jgi:hypothetical protein